MEFERYCDIEQVQKSENPSMDAVDSPKALQYAFWPILLLVRLS